MNQNELYHHGILGQKWGVRRYQNADGTRTPAGKKRRQSEDEDRLIELRKKGVKGMSNAELKEANNRLQLQANYINNSKQVGTLGKGVLGSILATTAILTVSQVTSKRLAKSTNKALDSGKGVMNKLLPAVKDKTVGVAMNALVRK